MNEVSKYLALDLGAESGRVIAGHYRAGVLTIEEIHRFTNEPVQYCGGLHWDAPRLWLELLCGLRKAGDRSSRFDGIGVDAWGLDYALLGEHGALLENPYHYRDARTDGIVERVCSIVPSDAIYRQTGSQFMQINGLYQLYAASRRTPKLLRAAEWLVTMPDLFNYWLTGTICCEFSNATTLQFFDLLDHCWARTLLDKLEIPTHFLAPIVEPGTSIGCVLDEVVRQTGLASAPVIAPACHDTGSAFAAVPSDERSAFLSSGTWSLLGAEVPRPVITAEAQRLNFTNEGGVEGTTRLLKNISGLWLLQSCRRHWQTAVRQFDYADLARMAEGEVPLRSLVDPDHPSFLRANNMPEAIAAFCRRTGQPEPNSPGAVTRTVLDSLALKYKYVLDALQQLTGVVYKQIRVAGGGARNTLLNQLTAEATGILVIAGPIEATALGNIAVQLCATAAVASLREARSVIDRSFSVEHFHPRDSGLWASAYVRFRQYCELSPL